MKRVLGVVLTILILLSMTACGNNGNFPKDDGRRFKTAIDAIYEKDGMDETEILIKLSKDEHVFVTTADSDWHLIADKLGYLSHSSIKINSSYKVLNLHSNKYPGSGGILESLYLANKHVISFSTVTQYIDRTIELSDNKGTEIKYGEYADEDTKWMSFFWVLDEIPEDYRVIIDGKEYELPKKNYTAEILFVIIGIAIITTIIVVVLKKSRYKR